MAQEDSVTGPPMIVATKILRAPRARIGKVYGNLRLPRSVELRSVGATLAGSLVGTIVWIFAIGIVFGYNFESFLYTNIVFGALGLSTLYIQPLKGEPLWRWILFKAASRKNKREKLHICTKPLDREAAGEVKMLASCVNVAKGSFDDRGALVRRKSEGAGVDESAMKREGFSEPKTISGRR